MEGVGGPGQAVDSQGGMGTTAGTSGGGMTGVGANQVPVMTVQGVTRALNTVTRRSATRPG